MPNDRAKFKDTIAQPPYVTADMTVIALTQGKSSETPSPLKFF